MAPGFGNMTLRSFSCPMQPPAYRGNVYFTKRFRFVASASGTAQAITPAKLGVLVGVCTTLNATVTGLFEQVRVKAIYMWAGPNTATLTPVQLSVSFPGSVAGAVGANETFSDVSVGATRVAHVCGKPDPMSQSAQWQNCGTGGAPGTSGLFFLTYAQGTVIDVVMDVALTNDARSSGNTVAVTTGVLTQLYYLALDNPAGGTGASGSTLVPDTSLITTT